MIGGCVRTTHPDIFFFVGGRTNHCNALIEILLLVIATAAREFCYQQGQCVIVAKAVSH